MRHHHLPGGSPRGVESSGLTDQRNQTCFNDHIAHTSDPKNTVGPDFEHDYTDDDDSSDWEDIIEDSAESSVDKEYFQHVDPKGNLTSRRSLIALMFQDDARSTLADGSVDAPLMIKGGRHPLETKEIPQYTAKPIAIPGHGHNHAPALSQETTRRNMLAMELTRSLYSHLLRERACNSSTANVALKPLHTSNDMVNFRQYPKKLCIKSNNSGSFDWLKNFKGYHNDD